MSENKNSVKDVFNYIFGDVEFTLHSTTEPTLEQRASIDRAAKIDEIRASMRMMRAMFEDLSLKLDSLSWDECREKIDQAQYCYKHNKKFIELFGNFDCEDCFVESQVRNDN